jgi:hypothetical protein
MWYTDGNWIKRQDGSLVASVTGNWTGAHKTDREMGYAAKLIAASPDLAQSLKVLWSRANAGQMPTGSEIEQAENLLRRIDAR